MYRTALYLSDPSAPEAPIWSMGKLVQLLGRAGLVDEVNELQQADPLNFDPVAMREHAIALQEEGNVEDAEEWWVSAAIFDDVTAMTVLAEKEEALGEIDSAAGYLLHRARCLPAYDPEKGRNRRAARYWDVVKLFCRAGRLDEAEEFWRIAIITDNGMLDLLAPGGESKVDADIPDEREWLRRAIADFVFPLYKIVWSFDPRAQEILRGIAESDSPARPFAMEGLADLLEREGRHEDAARWLGKAAGAGSPSAMRRLAQLIEEAGQDWQSEAEGWWRRAVWAGDEHAIWNRIQHHEAVGEHQEADTLWSWVLQGDDSDEHVDSIYRFVGWLAESGQTDGAESLARYVADTRGPHAWTCLAEYLVDHLQYEEAEMWLRRAILVGQRPAYEALLSLLRKRKPQESGRLLRFGVDPDGKTSERWDDFDVDRANEG